MFVFLLSGVYEIDQSEGASFWDCFGIRHKSKRSAKASTDLSANDKSRATGESREAGSPTVDATLRDEANVGTDRTGLNRGSVEF